MEQIIHSNGIWNTDSDITLTAKWTANNYTITLNPNGGSVSSTAASVTYGQNYTEATQGNYDTILGNVTTQATTETFVENTQPAQIDYGKINPIEQGLGFEEYKKTNY